MTKGYLLRVAWHGLSQAILTGGGIIVALDGWPSDWNWLVIGVTSLLAAVKGVEGYVTLPEAK